MIAFLQGQLVEKHPTHVIVDVQGVGYHVNISLSSYESLVVEDGRVNSSYASLCERRRDDALRVCLSVRARFV